MKKYLPISAVLLAFFSLVFLRNFKFKEEEPVVGQANTAGQINTTNTPTPTNVTTNINSSGSAKGRYKDGTFTGTVEDAYYGNYQVAAVISGGQIVDINFLEYPNDNRTSRAVNTGAMVYLKSEALQAQSAKIDTVSGASSSSEAFRRSLNSALKKATP